MIPWSFSPKSSFKLKANKVQRVTKFSLEAVGPINSKAEI